MLDKVLYCPFDISNSNIFSLIPIINTIVPFCSNQITMVYSIGLNVLVHVVVVCVSGKGGMGVFIHAVERVVRPDGGLITLHVDADVLGVVVCYLSKF